LLKGANTFPNSAVRAPPTYAGQKSKRLSRAVARSAARKPSLFAPNSRTTPIASPRATQNAAAIQSQRFCRTFIVTPIRLSPSGTGVEKLVARFPNCLDLEVWSGKAASLVFDEGSTANFAASKSPMTAFNERYGRRTQPNRRKT
jgi:hypothetical protein